MKPERRGERVGQGPLLSAVTVGLGVLILIQTLLLNVALECYTLGDTPRLSSASLASGLCFAAAWWLLRRIISTERRRDPVWRRTSQG